MANQYGLIGYPLSHSSSKKHFDKKFADLKSKNSYNLFEMSSVNELVSFISKRDIKGLNVTIPHKQAVIPLLHKLDKSAELVGAVNVIVNNNDELTGFNTDYPAFKTTLKKWLDNTNIKALVLGTGGASKAVIAALQDLKIIYQQVSRIESKNSISYHTLNESPELLTEFKLIINTTPLGMAPNIESKPSLPYNFLTPSHLLYDLVYNPIATAFLQQGVEYGCQTKNGLEMLHLQAELAWDIWNG